MRWLTLALAVGAAGCVGPHPTAPDYHDDGPVWTHPAAGADALDDQRDNDGVAGDGDGAPEPAAEPPSADSPKGSACDDQDAGTEMDPGLDGGLPPPGPCPDPDAGHDPDAGPDAGVLAR